MTVAVRPIRVEDAPAVGEIIAGAFNTAFQRHNFPPPFASVQAGQMIASLYAQYPESQGFVAEQNGRIVGSGFLHIRGDKAGIGPVTVDPTVQGGGVGRAIMLRLLQEARDCRSVRLMQDAFNNVSFALYAKLGFVARDVIPLLVADDPRPKPSSGGAEVRLMTSADLGEVASLDERITGLQRRRDFELLFGFGNHLVCERSGRLTGYLCYISAYDSVRLGPGAADDLEDLKGLLHHAVRSLGPRTTYMRLLASQEGLLRYAFEAGFKVSNVGTYMVKGDWRLPDGAQITAQFPEAI